jgi:DNA-binding MarR family transcriptional regulator
VLVDARDRRARRIALTDDGRACLAQALPLWVRAHAQLEANLAPAADPGELRSGLAALSRPQADAAA